MENTKQQAEDIATRADNARNGKLEIVFRDIRDEDLKDLLSSCGMLSHQSDRDTIMDYFKRRVNV